MLSWPDNERVEARISAQPSKSNLAGGHGGGGGVRGRPTKNFISWSFNTTEDPLLEHHASK